MVAGPEFTRDIRARVSRESDPSRGHTATGMEGGLRYGAGGCVSRQPTHSRTSFSGPRITRNHRTRQGMPESWTEAALGGTMIMQIFVKRRGHQVLNGLSHGVSSESCAQALSEARCPPSVVSWMTQRLSQAGPGTHTCQSALTKCGMLPVLTIGMGLLRRLGFCRTRNS